MRKKSIISLCSLIIFCMLITFSGCLGEKGDDINSSKENQNHQKQMPYDDRYNRIKPVTDAFKMSYPIVSISETEFYVTENGIEKADLETKKAVHLFDEKDVASLYLDGEDLYYSLGNSIYKYNGIESEKVWDSSTVSQMDFEFEGIDDFCVLNNNLYVKSQSLLIEYRMDIKTISHIIKDLDEFVFYESSLVYTSKNEDLPNIYSFMLKTGEEKTLIYSELNIDAEEIKEKEKLYQHLIVIENSLFYVSLEKKEILCYDFINETISIVFENYSRAFPFNSDGEFLYFASQNNSNSIAINKYDTSKNQFVFTKEIDGFSPEKTFTVFKDILFFYKDNEDRIFSQLLSDIE